MICNSCQQTIPEFHSYRTAPISEENNTKQQTEPQIKWYSKLMTKLKTNIILMRIIRFIIGLIGAFTLLTIGNIIFPAIFHLGRISNVYFWHFSKESVYCYIDFWGVGLLTIAAPFICVGVLYLIYLLGAGLLNKYSKK